MEIAPTYQKQRFDCVGSADSSKAQAEIPLLFLSNMEVQERLESNQTPIIKPIQNPTSTIEKVSFVAIIALSLVTGFLAYIITANLTAEMDHSGDAITPYRCEPRNFSDSFFPEYYYQQDVEFCERSFKEGTLTAQGLWIDHKHDRQIPGYDTGKTSMALVSALPPLLSFIAWGMWKCITWQKNASQIAAARLRSAALIDAQCALIFSSSSPSEPLHPKLISRLCALQVLTVEDFSKLSFRQIRQLRKEHMPIFEKHLAEQHFSEQQHLYWNKLRLMAKAGGEKLILALQNYENASLFEKEPLFLETLIQELAPNSLSDAVKRCIVTRLREYDEKLQMLPIDTLMHAVESVSKQKISLNDALADLTASAHKSDQQVLLRFEGTKKSLTISKALLCQASPVFKAMLQTAKFKEGGHANILLKEVNLAAFDTALLYLKSGKIELDDIDLQPILKVVDQFAFSSLKVVLEEHLFDNLNSLLEIHSLGVMLDVCEKYNLDNLKRALDLKFRFGLLHEERDFDTVRFIDNLHLATEFQLSLSTNLLLNQFSKLQVPVDVSIDVWCQILFEMAEIDKDCFQKAFESCRGAFEKLPLLLKKLWELAAKKPCTLVEETIVSFCSHLSNAHIYLAIWDLPPKRLSLKIK